MLVQVQQWATLGSGYPESRRGSIPQGSAFDSQTQRFKTLTYRSIIQMAECADKLQRCWFESNLSETGLLPGRTQGAGLSRRLAGEVYWLALNPAASVMKRSNILQRTGIIGSNPIVAVFGQEKRNLV